MNASQYDDEARAAMLAHLEKTYGTTFVLQSFTPAGSGFTRDRQDLAHAAPASDASREFLVTRSTADSGETWSVRDGYSLLLAQDALVAETETLCRSQWVDAKVKVFLKSVGGVTETAMLAGTSAREFMRREGDTLAAVVDVFVPLATEGTAGESERIATFASAIVDSGELPLAAVSVQVYYGVPADRDLPLTSDMGYLQTAKIAGASRWSFTELKNGVLVYPASAIEHQFSESR
jgi:hypothetical protein